MKSFPFSIIFLAVFSLAARGQSLYDDSRVSTIYLTLPPDSLDFIIENEVNDRYLQANFVFDDGSRRDTVPNVGLRLRGNTSLAAQKKSFKVSFNEFEAGRKYQGVKKLNLRGSHNDPSMIREKLFFEVAEKAGMPLRRASFVRLFINEKYRGLYTNLEEVDKEWLDDVFGDDDGNLFKCTYPADLTYLGGSQQSYKNVMNNATTRAYDLTTNETEDDYSRLVALITALNLPPATDFETEIQKILNVESVLKSLALDVATGNWDDYFYNKNNYYLYDNPATGRFEFFPFDTDNTFGVDWLNVDWAKRNALRWYRQSQPRPLATQLLAVPKFRQRFVQALDSVSQFIVHPDSIFPRIDALHGLIIPAAKDDIYRTLDYGYTMADFHNSFSQTIDNHTPYGIKPFLGLRFDSTMRQLSGLVSDFDFFEKTGLSIFPNPASERLLVDFADKIFGEKIELEIVEPSGRVLRRESVVAGSDLFEIWIGDLPEGLFWLRLRWGGASGDFLFFKKI